MAQITLPHFGTIDSGNLEEYYDVEVTLSGNTIEIGLNFDGNSIDTGRIEAAKKFLDNIGQYLGKTREYITADFGDEESDSVKFYLSFHKEEMGEAELREELKLTGGSNDLDQQLIAKLQPARMAYIPEVMITLQSLIILLAGILLIISWL
ncbi:hypothetical protein SAMN04488505_10631 [Chitinophaga rupis]|uniref:Uncharacterized protein n=1 Tax=Chitinophaga rupis TaxID=573321 RepID=A0A1H8AVN5_9BACT|nr:DUF2004 domain-containing protein [Chitinophaga rupis]SEM74623.1 hypothetical protein SAMN04488505_10631 [Chitinophaga rupis]